MFLAQYVPADRQIVKVGDTLLTTRIGRYGKEKQMEKPTDAEERREYIREQMRKAKKEWEQLRRKWELENRQW